MRREVAGAAQTMAKMPRMQMPACFRRAKITRMKKKDQPTQVQTAKFVIGRERFAKISAVEGMELSKPMKARAAELERAGLSDKQKRDAIIGAHRKA